MTVSRELEMTIANEMMNIKSLDVVYENGNVLSGFIKSAKFIPLSVTLCEHVVPRGQNPYHYLDFDDIATITITYHDGRVILFP